MDAKNNKPRFSKLSPEMEAQLPEYVQLIRKFYFSLSEEDMKKLDSASNASKDNVSKENWITILQRLQKEAETESKQETKEKPQNNKKTEIVAAQRSKETDSDNLKLLVSVLKDVAAALHKDESLTPAERKRRVLEKLHRKVIEAFNEAENELDSIR